MYLKKYFLTSLSILLLYPCLETSRKWLQISCQKEISEVGGFLSLSNKKKIWKTKNFISACLLLQGRVQRKGDFTKILIKKEQRFLFLNYRQ